MLRPYIRVRDHQPLVVLTEPASHGLCIDPDGTILIRPLYGVGGGFRFGWNDLTDAQLETLRQLSRCKIPFIDTSRLLLGRELENSVL